MKKNLQNIIILLLMFLLSSLASSQSYIVGKITDANTKELVPFVNIHIKNYDIGTISNLEGYYKLEIPEGDYEIIFSSLGYNKIIKKVKVLPKQTITINISLKPIIEELNTVVVAASKTNQKIEETVNTIQILKPQLIENKNVATMDKALQTVPGVAIVDNEPQIRGGSGFSSGLGSRVMILVDGIPMLSPDANRPVWNFLPVENIEQIEIIKGPASVMYGSSAMNGVINIRTAYPKEKSTTKVTMYSGVYSTPNERYKSIFSKKINNMNNGINFLHTQRIDNVDLIVGGSYINDQGFIAGPIEDPDNDYENGAFEKNIRLNFNTRVRSKKIENLVYGLNGNFMSSDYAESYIWADADTNIYRTYSGAMTNFNGFQYYLDPYVKYYGKNGFSHTFNNRFYHSNSNASNNQSTMSYFLYNDYTLTKKFYKIKDFVINTGITNTYSYSYGEVFSGIAGVKGSKKSENFAVNAHLEKKFFNTLTFSTGARWEYYKLASYEDNKPVFMAGLNIKATKITYLRVSYGQGFRFPSIGERYISTSSGGFGVYPNPDLKSETSWNTEVGLKQLFKISKFQGVFDVSYFRQEYNNYVEFNAGLWGTNPDFSKNLGYKFLNTAKTRVSGVEVTIMGKAEFTKDFSMTVLCGYTYTKPIALEPNKEYYVDTNQNMTFDYIHTSSDTSEYILKYRIENLAKIDFEFNYKKMIFGFNAQYYGFMRNIDKFFYNFDRPGYFETGIKEYRKNHNTGTFVYNMHIGYDTKNRFKFALLIKNIFNTEYSLRPMLIEAPRLTTIQIIYKIHSHEI